MCRLHYMKTVPVLCYHFLSGSVLPCCPLQIANENSLQNSGDVQSGPSGETISRMDAGRGVGAVEISGFILKNVAISFRDNWSAAVFLIPGKYMIGLQGLCHNKQ